MPLDLNAFRNFVSHASDDSFVRMSGRTPDKIVNFGRSRLGRKLGWYRHAKPAETHAIREQLFRALSNNAGAVQNSSLDQIRNMLGIDARGKASVSTQLTAREVKQIISAFDHAKDRQAFSQELQAQFPNNAQQQHIAQRLGLSPQSQPGQSLAPLTEEDKHQLLHELHQMGRQIYDNAVQTLGLPDLAELKTIIPNPQVRQPFEDLMKKASFAGTVSSQELATLKEDINAEQAKALQPQLTATLNAALAQLQQDTGINCATLAPDLTKTVQESLAQTARQTATVIRNPNVLLPTLNQTINALVAQHKAVLQAIIAKQGELEPAVYTALINLATSDAQINDPQYALKLADHANAVADMIDYGQAPNPDLNGFLQHLHTLSENLQTAAQDCKATLGPRLGEDKLQNVHSHLATLGKFIYMERHNQTPPPMGAPLKDLCGQVLGELQAFRSNPEAIEKDYCFSAHSQDFAQLLKTGEACRSLFAPIDQSQIDADAQRVSGSFSKLSPELGKHLQDTGLISTRYADPFNKTMQHPLGTAFREMFLDHLSQELKAALQNPTQDYSLIFAQNAKDYYRPGIGLTLDGHAISQVGNEEITGGFDALKNYFAQDQAFGERAAKAISTITHQGVLSDFSSALMASQEGGGITFTQPLNFAVQFDVTRLQNGQYDVHVKCNATVSFLLHDGQIVPTDSSRTHITLEGTLHVDVPQPPQDVAVAFKGNPTIDAHIQKLDIDSDQYQFLIDLKAPGSSRSLLNDILSNSDITADPNFLRLLKAPRKLQDIYAYLQDKIITTREHECLRALGLDAFLVKQLQFGLHPQAHLTKALMTQLVDPNPATRATALNQLQNMCQELTRIGWSEPLSINADDLALVTVGGLRHDFSKPGLSDITLVRNYIENAADATVRNLTSDLASSDIARVNSAKARLTTILNTARRNTGLNLLVTCGFHENDIKILASRQGDAEIPRLMEHIVLRDDQMQESIRQLQDMVHPPVAQPPAQP